MAQPQPVHRPGRDERVIARLDARGELVVTTERLAGRAFASTVNAQGEIVAGYVTDGRVMLDVLGSLHAPSHFFQVWLKVLSLQKLGDAGGNVRGYVKTTQRDLQKRCELPASSVNEAMQYWSDLPWIRNVKRGLFQTNPFLTAAGSSAEHAEWQTEWARAVGETFLIPDPEHPAAWRAERAELKAEAKRLKAAEQARLAVPANAGPNVLPLRNRKSDQAGYQLQIPIRSAVKGA